MAQFSLTEQTNLFKINYYKKSENMYNSENVLQGRIRKRYDFSGKERFVATPMSFSGGVGSGTLPVANSGRYEGAHIYSKKVYATCEIEREAIKASIGNEGAFVRATQETVKKAVESYMRNASRILFSDGSGLLGQGLGTAVIGGTGTVATPWLVTVANFNQAYWEERDYVQLVTGITGAPGVGTVDTNLLEIVAVNPATKVISLVGTSAALTALQGAPLPATAGFAMQGSFYKDPMGLDGIVKASILGTGNLYDIPVQRRWSMTVSDAATAGITADLMNGVMLAIERKFGKSPKMIMTGYVQFQKMLALMEDQKVYNLPNRNIKGQMSFQGVEFMSTRGPIGIFVDRFCPDDRVFFLNDDFIEVHHRPDFGWFDDDGTVFLRVANKDSYDARYGGYYENYITPTPHGVLYNLAL